MTRQELQTKLQNKSTPIKEKWKDKDDQNIYLHKTKLTGVLSGRQKVASMICQLLQGYHGCFAGYQVVSLLIGVTLALPLYTIC